MRTHGSASELEAKRRRAMELVDEGLSSAEVARRLKVSDRSVRRWRRAVEERGQEALSAVPHPGKPSKLSARQKADLTKRLVRGAQAEGFDGDLWTCPRVKELILRRFGIDYHVDALPYLLKTLGFSCQKPQLKSAERDEEAIATWVRQDWPRIKKSPAARRSARLRR